MRELWKRRWFRYVSYTCAVLLAVILIWDIVLFLTGKPTISGITRANARFGIFVTAFCGILMGHFFIPLKFPRLYVKIVPWIAWSYLLGCLIFDLVRDISVPRWMLPILFLVNFGLGGVLWPMNPVEVKGRDK